MADSKEIKVEIELKEATQVAVALHMFHDFISGVISLIMSYPIVTVAFFLMGKTPDHSVKSILLTLVAIIFVDKIWGLMFKNKHIARLALYGLLAGVLVTHQGLMADGWLIGVVAAFLFSLLGLKIYNDMHDMLVEEAKNPVLKK